MNPSSRIAAVVGLMLSLPALAQENVAEPAAEPAPEATTPAIPVETGEAAATPPAAAEPAADADRSSLMSEIVVTAQKREEALQDVPISISAFSGDTLSALGVTDTAHLAALVPGFTYSNSGFGSPVYTLRGVGFTDGSFTASSTVGVYVDEVNLPFPILTKAANLDLQRVEVLKGPQGTLYGRNTTGGAVNYIANKPTDSFESGFDLSYGRFKTTKAEGFVSGPLGDDLKGRLAVFKLKSDEGWQKSHTRDDGDYDTLGEFDRSAARGTLDWQASDSLFNRFTLTYSKDKSDPQAPQAIGIDPQNPFGSAFLAPAIANYPLIPRNTNDNRVADWATSRGPQRPTVENIRWNNNETQWTGTARSDWSIDDNNTFTVIGSYIDFKIDNSHIPENGFNIVNVERLLNASVKAWSLEPRLSGTWGSQKNSWIVGVFLSNDKVHQDDVLFVDTNSAVFPSLVSPALPPVIGDTISVLGRQKADTIAAFANSDFVFTDQLKLTGGLRYTKEKRRYAGCSADGPDSVGVAGFAAVFTAVSLSRGGLGGAMPNGCFTLEPERGNSNGELVNPPVLNEHNVSGRVSLNWTPTDEMLYYLSRSRGYKSGSYPVISASDGAQLDPVTQERLDAYEVGAKTEWFDRSLRLNGALFYYKYKDKQLLTRVVDPIFGPLPILDNAPRSEVKGGELEAQYSPVSWAYVAFAGAYVKTKVLEFDSIDESGQMRSFAGNAFNFTPKLTYNALMNFEPHVTDAYKVILGADYTYVDKTNSVLGNDPAFAHDDYFNLNVRLGFGPVGDAWAVTAWGQNVTNELQTVSIFDPGDAVARFVGMTRTYGVSLKMRFD